MKKSDLFFNVIRLPVDFLMLILAGLTAYLLRIDLLSGFRPVLFQFELPLGRYLGLVAVVALIFLASYAVSGLYSMKFRMSRLAEFIRVTIGSSAGIMLVIIFIFLRQALFNSRFLVLGAWLLAIIFVFFGRLLIRLFQHIAVARYDFGIHRVLMIGNDDLAHTMKSNIIDSPDSGYRIVGHWQTPQLELLPALASTIDEILLVSPNYEGNHIAEIVDFCHENHIIFKFVPNLYQTLTRNFDVDIISQVPVIELKRTPLDGWGKVFKRTADIFGSAVGLVVLSPIFLFIALLIKSETQGPVFVSLKRVSKNREFNLYKFRSMINNAHELNPQLRLVRNDRPDAGPLWKMKDDPRITKIGKILRKYRIDELPQLYNVLKGDISLVGPRPHQPDEIARYEKHHKKVLAIKAGATGLAQISGSSDLPFDREVEIDSYYIENWSLWMDLKIIFKTFFKMLHDHSAV